ncbi:DUF3137 domain-containing protein [Parasphingopyxis sp.]|uniref:DUF3137 domain-containing protein n=1 Tax=Parasphingopyxis sp. TaxID=1920299 RepID=UPI00262A7722|nr:DUF3137 domain-containing protein [Parasphingopyxis sp.]
MTDGAINTASEFAYRKLEETRAERTRRGLVFTAVIIAAIVITLAAPALYLAIVGIDAADGTITFAISMAVFVLALLTYLRSTRSAKIAVNRLKREINGAIAQDIGFTYEPEAIRPPEFGEAAAAGLFDKGDIALFEDRWERYDAEHVIRITDTQTRSSNGEYSTTYFRGALAAIDLKTDGGHAIKLLSRRTHMTRRIRKSREEDPLQEFETGDEQFDRRYRAMGDSAEAVRDFFDADMRREIAALVDHFRPGFIGRIFRLNPLSFAVTGKYVVVTVSAKKLFESVILRPGNDRARVDTVREDIARISRFLHILAEKASGSA